MSMYSRPWYHWLAFGLGSGLSPWLPGTMGTLAVIPIYWLVAPYPMLYTAVLLFILAVGPWLCGRTARDLQVRGGGTQAIDPPAIVWDEWAGLLLTLWGLSFSWPTLLAGFLLFRFFDMLKPWPISWLDRRIHGGMGIMLDDLAAALAATVVLRTLLYGGWL